MAARKIQFRCQENLFNNANALEQITPEAVGIIGSL